MTDENRLTREEDVYGEVMREYIGSDAERVYRDAAAIRREARKAGHEPRLEVVIPKRWDYDGRHEIGSMFRMPVRFADVDTPTVQFASERDEPEIVGDLRDKMTDLEVARDRLLTTLQQRTQALGRTSELRVALTEALQRVLEVADVERGLVEATKVHDAMGSDVIGWLLDPSSPAPEPADEDDMDPDKIMDEVMDEGPWTELGYVSEDGWDIGQFGGSSVQIAIDPAKTAADIFDLYWGRGTKIHETTEKIGKMLDETLDREEARVKGIHWWTPEDGPVTLRPGALRAYDYNNEYQGRHVAPGAIVGVTGKADRPDSQPHLHWDRRRNGSTPAFVITDETSEWLKGFEDKIRESIGDIPPIKHTGSYQTPASAGTHDRGYARSWVEDYDIEHGGPKFSQLDRTDLTPYLNVIDRWTSQMAAYLHTPTPSATFMAGGEPGPVEVKWGIALPPTAREREMAEELMRYLAGGQE